MKGKAVRVHPAQVQGYEVSFFLGRISSQSVTWAAVRWDGANVQYSKSEHSKVV